VGKIIDHKRVGDLTREYRLQEKEKELIFSGPTEGDPFTGRITYRLRTSFVVVKLGHIMPV
jgi:hypothetical protein